jgi:hypothetical protein
MRAGMRDARKTVAMPPRATMAYSLVEAGTVHAPPVRVSEDLPRHHGCASEVQREAHRVGGDRKGSRGPGSLGFGVAGSRWLVIAPAVLRLR